jgi:hypothetical protein
MKRIFITILVFTTVYNTILAQDSIVVQDVKINQQYWLDYNFTNVINENQNLSTQIGFRKIIPEVFNRLQGISVLNIKNNNKIFDFKNESPFIKSYHLGAGLIYTQNYNTNDNLELRLIQGVKFEIPTIKPITLYNYVRLEERFQNKFDNSGWTSAFRLRYRLSTMVNWKKHLFQFTEGLYIPIQTEFFFNLKRADRFNDVVRISPGIGYKSKNDWRYETYIIFNISKNITETNNTSNDFILRLRVYKGNSTKQVLDINEDDTF